MRHLLLFIITVSILFAINIHPVFAACCVDAVTDCKSNEMCQIPPDPNNPSVVCSVSKPGICVNSGGTPQNPDFRIPSMFDPQIPELNSFKFLWFTLGAKDQIGPFIGEVLPWIFGIAGLLLFFYLLYGAFQIVSAMGSVQRVTAGQKIMTNALLGYALLACSYWIAQLLSTLLGLKFGV